MLETLKQSIIIDFTISLNSWIYFLKRVPLIKLLFKNAGYEHTEIVKALYYLGLISSMFKQLFKSAMLLLFSMGFSYLLVYEDVETLNKEYLYWQLFIIFYILLNLTSEKILEPKRRKFISVKLMRMNARKFVISDYFPELLWRTLIELPLFAFAASMYSVNIFLAMFMVVAKNFFCIFVEALKIVYYEKTEDFLHNKPGIGITYAIIIIFIGYYGTFAKFALYMPNLFIITLGTLITVIGILSFRYIIKYECFPSVINAANRMDKLNVDFQSVKKNAVFSKVKLKEKEFTAEELIYDNSNKKEGFPYINFIFFKRHKRILNGPIMKQAAAIVAIFAVCLAASYLIKDFHKYYFTTIKKGFPVFIYALYMMSTAQKATKAMFYNCDISLLHYGFYKTSEAVLATFTLRTKNLILQNMVPAAMMGAVILLLNVLTGGTVTEFIPITIMILVLSIFFVVHNMFLYYIFQPYTTDLTVKNPLYKLLNSITYLLCYISLQLRNMSITFLVFVVAATLIYSVAALITVYRIAPKTFIIK